MRLNEGVSTIYRYFPTNALEYDIFPKTIDIHLIVSRHVETCILLVREFVNDDDMVSIKVDLDGISLDQGKYIPPEKPTYGNIKRWISETYGLKVSNFNIGQIKDKAGIKERKNYNIESAKVSRPNCPSEKEAAIMDVFRHFHLI